MVIDDLIVLLLKTKNKVVIPKVGAFETDYHSAIVDIQNKSIAPPLKEIKFDATQTHNDGLLASLISEQNGISFYEAEKLVENFADKILTTINSEAFKLNNIGEIYLNNIGNIAFKPVQQTTTIQNTYGLPALEIEPIQRLKEEAALVAKTDNTATTKPIVIPVQKTETEKNTKKETSSNLWVLIPFLIIGVIGTILFVNKNYISSLFNKNKKTPTNTSIITKDTIQTDTSTLVTTPIDTLQIQPEIKQPEIQQAETQQPEIKEPEPEKEKIILKNGLTPNAYICIGSVKSTKSADELINKAKKFKLPAISYKEKGSSYYRVLVPTHESQLVDDFETILFDINEEAYIYCKKCNLD